MNGLLDTIQALSTEKSEDLSQLRKLLISKETALLGDPNGANQLLGKLNPSVQTLGYIMLL